MAYVLALVIFERLRARTTPSHSRLRQAALVIAVVTGGSRGIGEVIAGALREAGFDVTSLAVGRRRRHGSRRRTESSRRCRGRPSRQQCGHHGRDPGRPGRSTRTSGCATSRPACSERSTAHAVLPGMVDRGRGRIVNSSGAAARIPARLGLCSSQGGDLQLHSVARCRNRRAWDRGLCDRPRVRLDGDDGAATRLAVVPRLGSPNPVNQSARARNRSAAGLGGAGRARTVHPRPRRHRPDAQR